MRLDLSKVAIMATVVYQINKIPQIHQKPEQHHEQRSQIGSYILY